MPSSYEASGSTPSSRAFPSSRGSCRSDPSSHPLASPVVPCTFFSVWFKVPLSSPYELRGTWEFRVWGFGVCQDEKAMPDCVRLLSRARVGFGFGIREEFSSRQDTSPENQAPRGMQAKQIGAGSRQTLSPKPYNPKP